MKLLLKLMYRGENYCGWQVQENGRTVQGELCRAFEEIVGRKVKVTGCSRTDSGVHAREYFCTVESEDEITVPPEKIPLAVNARLERDISVISARKVPDAFHARYDVKTKTYEYIIDNGRTHDPFLEKRSWHLPARLLILVFWLRGKTVRLHTTAHIPLSLLRMTLRTIRYIANRRVHRS